MPKNTLTKEWDMRKKNDLKESRDNFKFMFD